MKRIISVTIKRMADEYQDANFLGEYQSTPGPADQTIDRQERGDMARGQYRYFVATMSADDTGNPDSVEQDYQRMEALNRGDWWFIGIRADAVVQLTGDLTQHITSGGVWGIESDSGENYMKEIAADQLQELRVELQAIGLDDKTIDAAFAEATEERKGEQ